MDRVPKVLKSGEDEPEIAEEWQKEIEETTQRTKASLEKIEKNVASQSSDTKFIKYKPCQQSAAFNSGAKNREFIVGGPADTLEPPKFRHKRINPKPSGSPPVVILYSPPRHQQDWKIPPCIPNWKNPKGFTIPLDKRLAADGRGLQDIPTVRKFAQRSDALYNAMLKTSEAGAMRIKVEKEMLLKEKEQELRALAQKARRERTGGAPPPSAVHMPTSDRSDCTGEDMREDYEREKIREERKREREREKGFG
ncbi:hypothetical protein MKW94_014440 [Papaver nudicaule]|uniref:SKI-interacting protein SKIP SNW domain-containing protein n=1 Tax=Papaver nudicaule TaxID=74823 RepID=A0AA41S447_PAPNU|nr:hypothetical protein [Papaver nudicaule]